MAKMPKRIPSKLPDFWKQVNREGPLNPDRPELGVCWLWTGQLRKGYGDFYWQGSHLPAHRVACQLANGYSEDGHARHKCDTPLCVRPDHLEWGTNLENVRDRTSRMRGGTQFTPEDVREIRRRAAAGETPYTIVKAYSGVSATAIENIIKRKTWSDIE